MARAPKKPKNLIQAILDGDFKANMDLTTVPARTIELLIRMQKAFPQNGPPWNYLFKVVYGLGKAPAIEEDSVAKFRRTTIRTVRKTLERDHKRTLIFDGDTVRASDVGVEFADQTVVNRAARVNGLIIDLSKRAADIELRDLTGDTKKAVQGIRAFAKDLKENAMMAKLEPAVARLADLRATKAAEAAADLPPEEPATKPGGGKIGD